MIRPNQEVSWTDANAGTATHHAVRNGRLHVFWADATNGASSFSYLRSNGPSMHILTRVLEAVSRPMAISKRFPFNGYLYLPIYRKYGSSGLYESKCLEPTYGCTPIRATGCPSVEPISRASYPGRPVCRRGGRDRPAGAFRPAQAATPYLYVVYSHAGSPNYLQLQGFQGHDGGRRRWDSHPALVSAPSSLPI
jgi:hypothetical protein